MAQNDIIDLDPFVLQELMKARGDPGSPIPRPTIDQFSPSALAPDYLVQQELNIPIKDSKIKYEYNEETKMMELDRILHNSNSFPYNYFSFRLWNKIVAPSIHLLIKPNFTPF